jgi:hypothetical protein
MIYKIPKGGHRPFWPQWGFWFHQKAFTWDVCFQESCRYDVGSVDQGDYNKLCGVGFLPHHHDDSARFGWRFLKEKGTIELAGYCYVNGVRQVTVIGECEIDITYRIQLICTSEMYMFSMHERAADGSLISHRFIWASIPTTNARKFKYRLGLYFGGHNEKLGKDTPAPHDIYVGLLKLKE